MIHQRVIFSSVLAGLLFVGCAFAQEKEKSITTDDPRLPPIIPGGTVYDQEGRALRGITTAGPVIGNSAPDAPTVGADGRSGTAINAVDVIVDGRASRRADRQEQGESTSPENEPRP